MVIHIEGLGQTKCNLIKPRLLTVMVDVEDPQFKLRFNLIIEV